MSVTQNLGIGFVALLIPIAAELYSPETGLGFDVLIYKPFDYAYALLVGIIFLVANFKFSSDRRAINCFVIAMSSWLAWFVVSFLSIAQLHVALGYKL